MEFVRRTMWVGALAFGVVFLGLGTFFLVKGLDAKQLITAELTQENVLTSVDAESFGVSAGIPVTDAKTAKAQADVIEMHTTTIDGEVLKSGVTTVLYYSEMSRDLFVSPEARSDVRNSYLSGLNLRNALSMAVMGYGIADMAIGTGVMIILLGLASVGIAGPALYWARQAEDQVVREVSRRLTPAPLAGD